MGVTFSYNKYNVRNPNMIKSNIININNKLTSHLFNNILDTYFT